MGRMTFVFRRLLLLLPTALGVTIITFFMIHLIPGDPARTILGIHSTPHAIAILHRQWGLNRPLASQYWLFMDRLFHGNLGDQPVLQRAGLGPDHQPPSANAVADLLRSRPGRDHQRAAGHDRGEPQGRRPRPRSPGGPAARARHAVVLAGADPADAAGCQAAPVPGHRLRVRPHRPSALDVPARP